MNFRQKIYQELIRHKWDLAIITPGEYEDFFKTSKAHFVRNPYKNKWFADPFILDVTDSTFEVLVEEFDKRVKRGRIARLSISKVTYRIESMSILLDLETHLSFPAIMRINNSVFIYPENSASGSLHIYKYNLIDNTIMPYSILCERPLTDAIVYEYNSVPYIMATELPNPNGNVLKVFCSKNRWSGFEIFQEIKFSSKIARNAGAPFDMEGVPTRPAQICEGGYGMGLSFQAIDFKDNTFTFCETKRVLPPNGYTGLHTYNTFGGYGIIDCRRYVHRSFLTLLRRIKHLIYKI